MKGPRLGGPNKNTVWPDQASVKAGSPRIVNALLPVSVPAIAGTVVEAQAAQTEAATALLIFKGPNAEAQASQTEAASGKLTFKGPAVQAQASQAEAASGSLVFKGPVAQAQTAQTESSAGRLAFAGGTAGSQAAQTEASAGKLVFSGGVAQAQQAQTGSSASILVFTGSAATSQAPQTEAGDDGVRVGSVDMAQQPQTIVAFGNVPVDEQPMFIGGPLAIGSIAISGGVRSVQAKQTLRARGLVVLPAIKAAVTESTVEKVIVHGMAMGVQPRQAIAAIGDMYDRELEEVGLLLMELCSKN